MSRRSLVALKNQLRRRVLSNKRRTKMKNTFEGEQRLRGNRAFIVNCGPSGALLGGKQR
jgi:hypothetical protein